MSKFQQIGNDKTMHPADVLRLQQKSVSRAILSHLYFMLVCLMMGTMICTVLFVHGSPHQKAIAWFGILPFFFLLEAAACTDFIRFLRLRALIKGIHDLNTFEVTIHCQKVRFLCRANGRWNLIVCLRLINQNGEVYDYVYPRKSEQSLLSADDLIKRLMSADATLTCYCGTNLIHTLHIPKGLIS